VFYSSIIVGCLFPFNFALKMVLTSLPSFIMQLFENERLQYLKGKRNVLKYVKMA
jgi:hypothetical protein